MAFETIVNLRPAATPLTPANGVHVGFRKMGRKQGFVAITIGSTLASSLGLRDATEAVRLLSGSGTDAGKIAISHDVGGGFVARGKPGKTYRISVNAVTATRLFREEFTAFTADRLEVLKPAGNGVGKQFVFRVPDAALPERDR